MDINIKILNVGDADSILVSFEKEQQSLLILIDGGRAANFGKVKAEIDKVLDKYKKEALDLVVCTHYDEDHIEGLLSVLDNYDKIGCLWSFDTKQLSTLIETENHKSDLMFPSEQDDYIGSTFDNPKEKAVFDSLITSVLQEKQLLEKAIRKKLVSTEPVAGKAEILGWGEIEVIGPTQKYYDKLFPKNLDFDDIKAEVLIMAEKDNNEIESKDPCDDFQLKRSPISKVNSNSAIILVTVDQKKYLFAADAGIDSFYAIPDYEKRLKDIYWLKVPHHGSKNNINNDLIELMSPTIAAISGDKYISNNLVRCLEKHGAKVYTTKDVGDIEFVNGEFLEDNH